MVAAVLVVVGSSLQAAQFTWTAGLVLFVSVGAVIGLSWFAVRLPSLKADPTEVKVVDPWGSPQRMLRSDLAFIFRGQMLLAVRGGSFWDKSYVFVSPDGTVRMWPWAFQFTDNGVAEFAQRLQVPVRGDFTVQVKDRVDPAAT